MLIRRQSQHFHSQLLQCKQQLGLIGKQQIDIRTCKLNHKFGVFKVGMKAGCLADLELQRETGELQRVAEESFDFCCIQFSGW